MTDLTDAARIANDTASITLDDGKTYQLHYGFGGLRRIEERYGSVRNLLEKIDDGMGDGYYDAVFHGILFGLWKAGITAEDLEDLIEPSDQERYGPALNAAIVAAFPREAQELIRQKAEEAKATTSSPGPTSTTSPRSATAGPKKRSGK
jgi:hypothetical protein